MTFQKEISLWRDTIEYIIDNCISIDVMHTERRDLWKNPNAQIKDLQIGIKSVLYTKLAGFLNITIPIDFFTTSGELTIKQFKNKCFIDYYARHLRENRRTNPEHLKMIVSSKLIAIVLDDTSARIEKAKANLNQPIK